MGTVEALLTGGGLVALGSVIAGFWAARQASRRDREALHQQRIELAYVELGTYLSRYADWARSVHPLWGPVSAPDPLQPSERWRVETLVEAYGSEKARRLLNQWSEQARQVENAGAAVEAAQTSADPDVDLAQERLSLDARKLAMREAEVEIRGQMHKELTGRRRKSTTRGWTRRLPLIGQAQSRLPIGHS